MAKFRVKMKLTGLELEIEGSREDVPLITQNLGQQLGGLLAPAAQIVEAQVVGSAAESTQAAESIGSESSTRRRKPRKTTPKASAAAGGSQEISPVQWRHDTSKYGSPKQDWGGTNKSLWLLYVAGEEANVRELSGQRITATFNAHFRTAGPLRAHNVNRDLAKLKSSRNGAPPLVSEDTTQAPPAWFLTDAGRAAAQKLVAEALGQAK
jgi:hypothetical protein